MRRRISRISLDEDSTLIQIGINDIESDGQMDLIASTYSPGDGRLYPGIGRAGPRVINFAPILDLDMLPVSSSIRLLLGTCEAVLGCPVEIEFAINIRNSDPIDAIFYLLQVRSMVSATVSEEVKIDGDDFDLILGSRRTLGNGINDEISDIVFVADPDFDLAHSEEAREEIRRMNSRLLDHGHPYLLIGPGRWGSTDRWLGIPVAWSDISGSVTIVELPVGDRMIDPSQGSHFFQNLSSLKAFYFTLGPDEARAIDWDWLHKQDVIEKGRFFIHCRTQSPITIMVNGREGIGIIRKGIDDENQPFRSG